MKRSVIKVTQLLVLMTLCCALLAGNFFIPSPVAEAATKKTSISATKLTIPVGKMDSKVYWNTSTPWDFGSEQKVTVANKVKGATYIFASSNTKVVKISKDGGYLTGLKAGNATITCTQTYQKKNTTVGKCTVTVKKATFTVNEYESNVFAVGSDGFDLYDLYACGAEPLFNIAYRNPNATYTLTSDSNNLTIKEVKYDGSTVIDDEFAAEMLKGYIGKRYFYGYQFTAKQAGTYKITVKETYNKKTLTLGSFKVEIKDTSISEPKKDLLLGNYLNVLYLINYANVNTEYYFNIVDYDNTNPDNNVVRLYTENDQLYLYANKTGTAEVTVTIGTAQGTAIGSVSVVVTDAPCQSITVDSNTYTAYVNEEYFRISYDLEPYETTDKATIESDNPDVLKVEYNEEEGNWSYSPLKVGEANITIKCGSQSVVCKVVVEDIDL